MNKRFKLIRQTKEFECRLNAEDIIEAFKLPLDAEVTVTVPSGGDYSGDDLTIGSDPSAEIHEIVITWTEKII